MHPASISLALNTTRAPRFSRALGAFDTRGDFRLRMPHKKSLVQKPGHIATKYPKMMRKKNAGPRACAF